MPADAAGESVRSTVAVRCLKSPLSEHERKFAESFSKEDGDEAQEEGNGAIEMKEWTGTLAFVVMVVGIAWAIAAVRIAHWRRRK